MAKERLSGEGILEIAAIIYGFVASIGFGLIIIRFLFPSLLILARLGLYMIGIGFLLFLIIGVLTKAERDLSAGKSNHKDRKAESTDERKDVVQSYGDERDGGGGGYGKD